MVERRRSVAPPFLVVEAMNEESNHLTFFGCFFPLGYNLVVTQVTITLLPFFFFFQLFLQVPNNLVLGSDHNYYCYFFLNSITFFLAFSLLVI